MIGSIKGKVSHKSNNYIILDTGSVGYKVFVTPEILEHHVDDEIKLYIYHKVSETEQSLFGLLDFSSLQFFELLVNHPSLT